MFIDEIDELKENLERKEYLLQLAEQRSIEFEKMLILVQETDYRVQKKLMEMNYIPKDRKISSVVSENT